MCKLFLSEILSNSDVTEITATAIYELTTTTNKLNIKSSLLKDKKRTLEFKDTIREVCATNEICWILLTGGSLHVYDFVESTLKEIQMSENFETITSISCTYKHLYVITSGNQLIQITTFEQKKLYAFPRHQKIKKMAAGAEHCLLMTSNGDVFSIGCGLRGALGHGDVSSIDVPKQIEALAGLKIVDIASGSFHSVAISSFGDVYCCGWNTNGQLGLPKVAQHTFEKTSQSHQQVFTTPQLIELEDDEAIKNVYCGSKHTILKTERNRLFVTGLNNYGQLGLSSDKDDIDTFTELPVKYVEDKTLIVCGYWSTYLINTGAT